MFEDAGVGERGTDLRAVELLDRAEQRVDAMDADPQLEAKLRTTLVRSYASLGEADRAYAQARRALVLRDHLEPFEELVVLRYLAESLLRTGRLAEARTAIQAALEDLDGRLEGVQPVGRVLLGRLAAELTQAEGRPAEAAIELERVLEAAHALADEDENEDLVLQVEMSLLSALSDANAFARVEGLADRVVGRLASTDDLGSRRGLRARWVQARARVHRDPSPSSIAAIEALLPEVREALGSDHEETLTLSADIGAAHLVAGDAVRAAAILAEVARLRTERFGPDDPRLIIVQGNLAKALADAGNASAEATLIASYEASERILGPNHRKTLDRQSAVAKHLRTSGRIDEAGAWLEELVERADATMLPTERKLHVYRAHLGVLRRMQGRMDESIALLDAALKGLREDVEAGDEGALVIASQFAGTLVEAGHGSDAAEVFLDVVAGLRATLEPSDPRILESLTNLAGTYAQTGQFDRALDRFRDADAWTAMHLDPEHPTRLAVREALSLVLVELGRAEDALPVYDELARSSEQNPRLTPEHRSAFALGRARCLAAVANRPEETRAAYTRVIAMERARIGDADPDWIASLEAELEAACGDDAR